MTALGTKFSVGINFRPALTAIFFPHTHRHITHSHSHGTQIHRHITHFHRGHRGHILERAKRYRFGLSGFIIGEGGDAVVNDRENILLSRGRNFNPDSVINSIDLRCTLPPAGNKTTARSLLLPLITAA